MPNDNAVLFPYYGGKYKIAEWILSHFPKNYIRMHYIEPFAGGLAVFFKKNISRLESISDLDKNLFHLYKNIRDNYTQLYYKIDNTLYSENDFYLAKNILKGKEASSIDRAWAIYIKLNLIFSGTSHGGFGYTISSRFREKVDFVQHPQRFHNTKKLLNRIKDRLYHTQIFNRPADFFIDRCKDNKEVLMYLDPPYPSTQQAYDNQFTMESFNQMLIKLYDAKFKWLLSFYEKEGMHLQHFKIDPKFTFLYKKTTCTSQYSRSSPFKNKGNKKECLLINYKSTNIQGSLL